MRLAWLTDPHFDHVGFEAYGRLISAILRQTPDLLLLTGDISQAEDLNAQLRRLQKELSIPLLYVLGNHDFYGGSIEAVRAAAEEVSVQELDLIYLSGTQCVPVTKTCGVLGDDGWGDATVGDYDRSPVRLSDFQLIEDFRRLDRQQWRSLLGRLGRESAERLRPKLVAASGEFSELVVLTHVPPFREACWYEGRTTDDLWAPFFVCGAMGQMLTDVAKQFPDVRYTVLCGHTHHPGTASLLPNLTVRTGHSEYGSPRLTDVLDL